MVLGACLVEPQVVVVVAQAQQAHSMDVLVIMGQQLSPHVLQVLLMERVIPLTMYVMKETQ